MIRAAIVAHRAQHDRECGRFQRPSVRATYCGMGCNEHRNESCQAAIAGSEASIADGNTANDAGCMSCEHYGVSVNLRPLARVSLILPLSLIAKLSVLYKSCHQNATHAVAIEAAVNLGKMRYLDVCLSSAKALNYACTPALYGAFAKGFYITTEMFADPVNLSGVFPSYFAAKETDRAFGSLGPWTISKDSTIEGGVANPPFNDSIIITVITAFKAGLEGPAPYCRLAVLPYTKSGALRANVIDRNMQGVIIEFCPPGEYGFRSYSSQFTSHHWRDRYVASNTFIHIAIVAWINVAYAEKHGLEKNRMVAAMRGWQQKCQNPWRVVINENALTTIANRRDSNVSSKLTGRLESSRYCRGCEIWAT